MATSVWNKAALGGIYLLAAGGIGYGTALLTHTVSIDENYFRQQFREACLVTASGDSVIRQSANGIPADGTYIVKIDPKDLADCAEQEIQNEYLGSGRSMIAVGAVFGIFGLLALPRRKKPGDSSPTAPVPVA